MLYAFNDAKAAERHETQYFEMFCNRGIYHKGWTAVTRHGVPWIGAYKRGVRRRRLGAVRHQHRLDPGARPREGEPEEAGRAAAALPDRGDQVQRAAARRSHVRALQPGPRRPAAAHQGQHADPVRRHGPADRELGGRRSRTSRIRSPPRSRCRHPAPKGVIIAQGGNIERLEPLRQGRQAEALLQLLRHRSVLRRRRRSRSPPAQHQVRMEFKYDGGGLAKGGTVSLFVDGKKDGEGRVDRRCRWSSPPTRPATSARKAARRSRRTTARRGNEFSGEVNWVQIDLEKDDHDHLISPEERFTGRDGAAVRRECDGRRQPGAGRPRGTTPVYPRV